MPIMYCLFCLRAHKDVYIIWLWAYVMNVIWEIVVRIKLDIYVFISYIPVSSVYKFMRFSSNTTCALLLRYFIIRSITEKTFTGLNYEQHEGCLRRISNCLPYASQGSQFSGRVRVACFYLPKLGKQRTVINNFLTRAECPC
jgi:hypothetical protein